MERDSILSTLLDKPSTAKCEKIVKKLLTRNSYPELLALFEELINNEEEYVRIFAALGLGYLTGFKTSDLDTIAALLQKMSDDWSGKVITYGLIKAMTVFFQNNADFLLEKFETTYNNARTIHPVFLKTFLIAYAKFTANTRDNNHVEKIMGIIQDHIASDDIVLQGALSSAVNIIGGKFPVHISGKLQEWANLDNIFAFEVIRAALDKQLGKKISPALKTVLLKQMAESEHKRIIQVLESSRSHGDSENLKYVERVVHTLLHRINVWFLPFNWGANPYRGCVHGCDYCYARSSHEYLGNTKDDFERIIYVKINAAQALEKDLSSTRWKKQKNKLVNLGSVTDPYQKIEEKYEITRKILEVFLAQQNPVIIATKSNLAVRDIDLLKKLGKLTNVIFTISTLDEKLAGLIEKGAPPISKRLEAIETLKQAGITVGVLMIPIMPYINDDKDDICALVRSLHDCGVDYVIPDILNLRGDVKIKMDYFLNHHYPSLSEPYKKLFTYGKNSEYADKKYLKDMFDFLMKDCLEKYKLNDYSKMIKGKWQ